MTRFLVPATAGRPDFPGCGGAGRSALKWTKDDDEGVLVRPIVRNGKKIGSFELCPYGREKLVYLLSLCPKIGTHLLLGEYAANLRCANLVCDFIEELMAKAGIDNLAAEIEQCEARAPLVNIADVDAALLERAIREQIMNERA